ncbi:MAG: hypothetical protein HQK96_19105 [Nitrospirae bacterium]|nr:hypothetical protein [Nitrospirota bacterium]
MRLRNRTISFAGIIILSSFLVFVADTSAADSIREIANIIKEEMVYPRECRYILPAVIPSKAHDVRKNEEFLTVAKKLEIMGIVKLTQKDGITKIVPDENNYDIIQPNFNANYEVLSIDLILGTWGIAVTEVKTIMSKTIAVGQKSLIKRTRLYEPIMGVLDDEQKKLYSATPMEWEIVMENGDNKVKEKQVKITETSR